MSDARLRRDVVWNLVPVGLLAIVGLGLNFAVFTWWSSEALATFNLVTTAFFVVAVIGACGIQYSVLRAIAEAPDNREHVASVVVGALVPNVVLAAVMTGVFFAVRGPVGRLLHSEDVAEGMLVATPGVFCFAINKTLFNVTNGLRRMRAFAVYTSLRYVMILVGLVIAHAIGVAAARIAVIWTITEAVMFVVLAIELVMTVSLSRGTGWRPWVKKHLAFGARGVLATLAYDINQKLDVWMLGVFDVSKSLIGVYSLAGTLNEGAMQLAVVLQNNLNPVMAHSFAEQRPEDVRALAGRTRRWFVPGFVAACAIGALAFPVLMPRVLHDPMLHQGTWPFATLMLGLALASPWLPFLQILLMANRPGWHTGYVVTVVGLNFLMDVILIPVLGLPGAAIATASAIVVAAVLVRVLTGRLLGIRI